MGVLRFGSRGLLHSLAAYLLMLGASVAIFLWVRSAGSGLGPSAGGSASFSKTVTARSSQESLSARRCSHESYRSRDSTVQARRTCAHLRCSGRCDRMVPTGSPVECRPSPARKSSTHGRSDDSVHRRSRDVASAVAPPRVVPGFTRHAY